MGNFSYICKHCGKNIRVGELCVMKHIRHSKVLGEVTGHYDGYGRVTEEENSKDRFRGNNDTINGHNAICESEFDKNDSVEGFIERIYKEKHVDFIDFKGERISETLELSKNDDRAKKIIALIPGYTSENFDGKFILEKMKYINSPFFHNDCLEEFEKLPLVVHSTYSGIAVWHKKCYDEITENDKLDTYPSKRDKEQGYGKARKQYI